MSQPGLDLADAKRKIRDFIKEKVEESKADGVVLGISGGINSAVVAYLAVESLGSRRVLGLIMPDSSVASQTDLADANLVAEELCVETKLVDIGRVHRAFMKNFEPNKTAEGNLRARIRMAALCYYANSTNRIVAGTADRSEALIGYFAKYGDGGADMLPIGDLYKTEVRKLGEVLGISRRIITKRSSPRLLPGQTAEGELGMAYQTIDMALAMFIDRKLSARTISSKLQVSKGDVDRIVSLYEETAHKRKMPEVCKIRR